MRRLVIFAAIALVLTACASSSSRQTQARSQFEDIPVPSGLALDQDKSTIIESPTVKAARLVYKGRVEVTSLAAALRSTLEASGWRALSSTTSADKGTTQVYDKGGDSLQVLIYEGIWYTYVEMAGTKIQPGGRETPAQVRLDAQAPSGAPVQPQYVQPLSPVPATPDKR
jgi:hypothetical protein